MASAKVYSEKYDNINFLQKVIIVIGCFVVVVTLEIFFLTNFLNKDLLIDLLTFEIAMVALLYTAVNSHLNILIRTDQLEMSKKETAMRFIENTSTKENIEASYICHQIIKSIDIRKPDSVIDLVDKDMNSEQAVKYMLNYLERINIFIEKNSADEEILRRYFYHAIDRYWKAFKPWIKMKREMIADKDLFVEIERLNKRWNK
jgi:hypothetical protein